MKRTTVNLTDATQRQIANLKASGFGDFTTIVRVAIDRMHIQERTKMKTEKWDHVLIDGKTPGSVVQDGVTKSLVSTRRSDGEPGEQRDWYDNDRLTVTARSKDKACGDEPKSVKFY